MDEPACLSIGTEVSAKYRGAFCEAKVKDVRKSVKVKVNLKYGGSVQTVDDAIRGGPIRLGASVEVKRPDSSEFHEGIITKVTDASIYTVVFDDGDENTLRRTQLCLKGEKHFVKTDTLDELPLTHPEHFGTPVMKGGRGSRRRSPASALSDESDSESCSEDEDVPTYSSRLEGMVGQVVLLEQEDRKKTYWVPALVCQPGADHSTVLKTREHLLVRSFKDSKFYSVIRKQTKDFVRDFAMKNEDKALKNAFEKALLFFDAKELPQNWDKEQLLGVDSDYEDGDESSDDEPTEEKDRFVAQLYKFMDDRGTPINKAPTIAGNRDLNLYRLFRTVQSIGGYNRVTKQMKWRLVYSKMGFPTTNSLAANQIKAAYKKFLHAFEDFYRKLGSTMGTISRPIRSPRPSAATPTTSGGRSLLNFRDRESTPRSPGRAKSANTTAESTPEPQEPPVPLQSTRELTEIKTRARAEEKKTTESRVGEESETESDTPRKRSTRGVAELEKKSKGLAVEKKKAVREERDTKSREDDMSRERRSREEESREETTSERDEGEGRPQRKRGRKKRLGEDPVDDAPAVGPRTPAQPVKVKMEKQVSGSRGVAEQSRTVSSSEEDAEDVLEEDKSIEDDRRSNPARDMTIEYPVGSRLRVKYGKGKNIKVYDAKVVDTKMDQGSPQYKVHYAGWNIRYDEWVRKDRIVSCLDRPKVTPVTTPTNAATKPKAKDAKVPQTKEKKQEKTDKVDKKDKCEKAEKVIPSTPSSKSTKAAAVPRAPSSTSSTDSKATSRRGRSPPPPATNKPRPTRSTSVEMPLVHGLPPRTTKRRRRRRGSNLTDQTADSTSERSDSGAEDGGKSDGGPDEEDEEDDEAPPDLQQEAPLADPATSGAAINTAGDEVPPPSITQHSAVTPKKEQECEPLPREPSPSPSKLPAAVSPPRINSPPHATEIAATSPVGRGLTASNDGPIVETEKVSEEVVAKATKSPPRSVIKEKIIVTSPIVTEKIKAGKSTATEKTEKVVIKAVEAIKETAADSGKDSESSDTDRTVERTPSKRRTRKCAASEIKPVSVEEPVVVKEETLSEIPKAQDEKPVIDEPVPPTTVPAKVPEPIAPVKEEPEPVEVPTQQSEVPAVAVEEDNTPQVAKKRAAAAKGSMSQKTEGAKATAAASKKVAADAKTVEVEGPASTETKAPKPSTETKAPKPAPEPKVTREKAALAPATEPKPVTTPKPITTPAKVTKFKGKRKMEKNEDNSEESKAAAEPATPEPAVKKPRRKLKRKDDVETEETSEQPATTAKPESAMEETPVKSPPTTVPSDKKCASPPPTGAAMAEVLASLANVSPPAPVPPQPNQVQHVPVDNLQNLRAAPLAQPVATTAAPPMTPPATPPQAPAAPPSQPPPPPASSSPRHSTHSEQEANMEVENLMARGGAAGTEEGSAEDRSTVSAETTGSDTEAKNKEPEEEEEVQETVPTKKRKRSKRVAAMMATEKTERTRRSQRNVSDSDEAESSPGKRTSLTTTATAHANQPIRPCKYNFLDLGPNQSKVGEERIAVLVNQIKDLRTVYMGIKSEVAAIDRKRKRARRREREALAAKHHQDIEDEIR